MTSVLEHLEDERAISDLMIGWMHRDVGRWEQLLTLFHTDATIEVTWFEGKFADFVSESKLMGQSSFKTKHFISTPVLTIQGERALAETNAAIIADNSELDLGCVAHNRFFDIVEKRDGQWKILRRQSIYDTSYFTYPSGPVAVDRPILRKHPREYVSLAYLLEKSGFPVKRTFATKGSDLEKKMKDQGALWLKPRAR
jgi:hypothetical protein